MTAMTGIVSPEQVTVGMLFAVSCGILRPSARMKCVEGTDLQLMASMPFDQVLESSNERILLY